MELLFMKVLKIINDFSVLSQSIFSNDDSNNNQQKQQQDNKIQPPLKLEADSFSISTNEYKQETSTIRRKETPKKNNNPFMLNIENNSTDNIIEILKEHFKIAVEHLQTKQYTSAINNFKAIQELSESHKLYKSELKALEAIARIYDSQNKLDLSLSYYYKALNCADKSFNTVKKAELANNIASIHADLKQYNTSLKCYKEALFWAYLNNDDEAIDIILNSICTTIQEINFINKTVA